MTKINDTKILSKGYTLFKNSIEMHGFKDITEINWLIFKTKPNQQ